jgi:curli biogenesis system outer membrane secretion channel CsgG
MSSSEVAAPVMARSLRLLAALSLAAVLGACSTGKGALEAPAQADASPGAQALKKLPRKAGERVAVTIYEFRSELPGVSTRSATEMFKTALVQSGQFRVVERARLAEGALREKQLQQSGLASGKAASKALRGAQYVFEATLSEANMGQRERSAGVAVAGAQASGGSRSDVIAIDVRIVDVGSGDIVDAVNVRKSMRSDEAVLGSGNLVGTVLAQRGVWTPYAPEVQVQQRRSEGSDAALRAAINEAVLQLARRFE